MKEYKLRLPVMKRTCVNCGRDYVQHVDEKCLFDSTDFKPGRVNVSTQTIKCYVGQPKPPEKK
jgi:hypothetical protein